MQALPAAPLVAPPAALPPPFATLAAELRLHASDRAQDFGPIAAIQALILALLARLLGRLDGMFQRWQQGQLPPIPPARARTRTRTTPAAAPRPKALSPAAWNPFIWDDACPTRPSSRQAAPAACQPPGIRARPSRRISTLHPHAQATPRVCAPAATPALPIPYRVSFQKPAQPARLSRAPFVA